MNFIVENKNYKGSGIYCIWSDEDEKNRIYFGQTIDYNKRLTNHKNMLKRKVHPNMYLQHMINKGYILKAGLVEDCNRNELCNREKYWIDFFDTTNPNKGFNLEKGGRVSSRTGISGSLKGRKQSKEHILARTLATKGILKPMSESTLRSVRLERKARIGKRQKGKKVKVTDTNTGIVTIFNSKREVEDFLGYKRDALIHKFYYGKPRKILKEIKYNNYLIER